MKRYILFAGLDYYPKGGLNDYAGMFATRKAALQHAATVSCDWWHVLDTETGEVVEKSS